eukprot:4002014-Lingulodinium_polyedra.AAC.1
MATGREQRNKDTRLPHKPANWNNHPGSQTATNSGLILLNGRVFTLTREFPPCNRLLCYLL